MIKPRLAKMLGATSVDHAELGPTPARTSAPRALAATGFAGQLDQTLGVISKRLAEVGANSEKKEIDLPQWAWVLMGVGMFFLIMTIVVGKLFFQQPSQNNASGNIATPAPAAATP